jgi:hypothetical protein
MIPKWKREDRTKRLAGKRRFYRRHRKQILAKGAAYREATRADYNERARNNQHRRLGVKPTRPRPEVCEICYRAPRKKALAADHDHTTKKFRGWICDQCNIALGMVGDSVTILQSLIDYVKRHQ